MTVSTIRPSERAALVRRELRLCRSWWQRAGLTVLMVSFVAVPLSVTGAFESSLINLIAIATIGAVGLNLSMGYAGQISLGHSFFLAVGAYTAVKVGMDWQMPLPVWLLAAAIVSGLLGAVVGLFSLRLRGPYLVIVTLALVFFGIYLFSNWASVSGGVNGRPFALPVSLGPLDFSQLSIGGQMYNRDQSLGVLACLVAGGCILIAHNIVRSGFGRAMLAVREQDIAAEVLGVRLFRTKVISLAVGSAMGGVAGALLANQLQFVLPSGFDLNMAIQYVAIIVIGGMGTTFGPVLGATFVVALPQLISKYSSEIPLLKGPIDPGLGISTQHAGILLYGVLIVATLIVAPGGLAGLGASARKVVHRLVARRGNSQARTETT